MTNYSVNTFFHLDWPKEACDSLKKVVNCVLEEKSPNSPDIQSLGTHTREVLLRFLESYEPLGVNIEDHPDGGIVVEDKDGMFAPNMMADLLSAIMKDHEIPGVVSFAWAEKSGHEVSGGEAVISSDTIYMTHLSDLIERMRRLEKTFEKIVFKNDEEPKETPPTPWW